MAQGSRTPESGEIDTQAVANDVEQLKEDVRRLTNTLEQVLRSRAERGRDQAAAHLEEARRRATELRDEIGASAEETVQRTRTTVAERPFTSLAAALGLGILLGTLMRRH